MYLHTPWFRNNQPRRSDIFFDTVCWFKHLVPQILGMTNYLVCHRYLSIALSAAADVWLFHIPHRQLPSTIRGGGRTLLRTEKLWRYPR